MTPEIISLTHKVDMGTDVVGVINDNVELSTTVETPENCKCCICNQPEVMIIPEYLKVCGLDCVEESSSVVTIVNE